MLETTATQARVELTIEDVTLITNALNEVCNGIDLPEFSTRLGATLEDARALLRQVNDIYRHMQTQLKRGGIA